MQLLPDLHGWKIKYYSMSTQYFLQISLNVLIIFWLISPFYLIASWRKERASSRANYNIKGTLLCLGSENMALPLGWVSRVTTSTLHSIFLYCKSEMMTPVSCDCYVDWNEYHNSEILLFCDVLLILWHYVLLVGNHPQDYDSAGPELGCTIYI